MAAASVTWAPAGRSVGLTDLSIVPVTVTATATTYTSATGGLPFDLAAVLNGVLPNDSENIVQPVDVIGILAPNLSTNGYLPIGLTLGTATTQNVPGSGFGSASTLAPATNVRPDYTWATVPATIRLVGTGSANHGALGEVSDGAVTDTITFWLVINRAGSNT